MNKSKVTIHAPSSYPHGDRLAEFVLLHIDLDCTVEVLDAGTQILAGEIAIWPPSYKPPRDEKTGQTMGVGDFGLARILKEFERANPWPSNS